MLGVAGTPRSFDSLQSIRAPSAVSAWGAYSPRLSAPLLLHFAPMLLSSRCQT